MTETNNKTRTTFTLTPEQQTVVDKVIEWRNGDLKTNQLTVGGYAGTGKTTIAKHIINDESFGYTAVCAFTGKAASVLRRKGLTQAQTLHSLIYLPVVDPKTKVVSWVKRATLNDSEGDKYDSVLVDEASMLSKDLYTDLMSFGLPVLYIGDHGQLEPIGDNPGLMLNPDLRLETIHRQAAESPILMLAHKARQGMRIGLDKKPGLEIVIKSQATQFFNSCDQILCAFNRTRHKINREIFHCGDTLLPDQKIVCLKNNRTSGVFNGQLFVVKKKLHETDSYIDIDAVDEEGNTVDFRCSKIVLKQPDVKFEDPVHRIPRHEVIVDYGYALTVHKAQGSEWDKVVVMEELAPFLNASRWRYTAITRAAKELIYGI